MLAFETVAIVLILLFGILGAMRGWAKEIVATAGIILALFIDDRLFGLGPVQGMMTGLADDRSRFWVRTLLFLFIVFIAYQGPALSEFARSRLQQRETVRQAVPGAVIGLINGFLIVGTLWYFLRVYCYPFPDQVIFAPIDAVAGLPICPPPAVSEPQVVSVLAQGGNLVRYLPLVWITPFLPYLLALFFLFVMVVLI